MNQLPFPKELFKTITHKLEKDLILRQWCIAAGTMIKLCQTSNFGVVIIAPNTRCKQTNLVIPDRVFSI